MLAGGRGERLGGSKPLAVLDGRPLLHHALGALRAATSEVVVVAKPATDLGEAGVPVWFDEAPGFHPRNGIVTALRGAAGAPVLVLAVDLPRADVRPLLATSHGTAVARDEDGRLQPLCALYAPEALAQLEAAPAGEPLTRTVERLAPRIVDLPRGSLVNVNTPQDLIDAAKRGTPRPCHDD